MAPQTKFSFRIVMLLLKQLSDPVYKIILFMQTNVSIDNSNLLVVVKHIILYKSLNIVNCHDFVF